MRRATRARASSYLPSLKVILLGGMQEPGHGAGSVLYALLTHPDALAEVRADLDGLLPRRDRRGHALDRADRHPGAAHHSSRSSSAASSCRRTRRSPR